MAHSLLIKVQHKNLWLLQIKINSVDSLNRGIAENIA